MEATHSIIIIMHAFMIPKGLPEHINLRWEPFAIQRYASSRMILNEDGGILYFNPLVCWQISFLRRHARSDDLI